MCRIALPKDSQGLVESRLLDETVPGKIATRRVAADEVLLGEERLRTRVVSSRKVDLGQPKGIVVVVYKSGYTCISPDVYHDEWLLGGHRLVKARSLSPIKMADSYCALLRASCLQSLRNFSIL